MRGATQFLCSNAQFPNWSRAPAALLRRRAHKQRVASRRPVRRWDSLWRSGYVPAGILYRKGRGVLASSEMPRPAKLPMTLHAERLRSAGMMPTGASYVRASCTITQRVACAVRRQPTSTTSSRCEKRRVCGWSKAICAQCAGRAIREEQHATSHLVGDVSAPVPRLFRRGLATASGPM